MKLFISEERSVEVRDTVRKYDEHVVSEISWAEAISAFSRMRLIDRISEPGATKTVERFKEFWPSLEHIRINWALIEEAADIALRHQLRAYDSIQLASACLLNAATKTKFYSWDKHLNAAASKEGVDCLAF